MDVVQSTDGKSFVKSFIARRVCPAIMVSDKDSAFVGDVMQIFTANRMIEWRFNKAFAPWQGGIWERLVSCVKRCLKKVVEVRKISFVQSQTLVLETETILTILNRPISHDYDTEIEDCLTLNHMLYGRRIKSVNEQFNLVINVDDSRELSKREKLVHASIAHFWDVRRKEYSTSLRDGKS